MAVSSSAVYDWANKPQECLTILQSASQSITTTGAFQEGQQEKCRSILESLSDYLKRFIEITGHPLLKDKRFYLFTDTLQKLDKSIAELWKNACFRACCLTSNDVEEQIGEVESVPSDVKQWLVRENANRVISYLNNVVLTFEFNHKLDKQTTATVTQFYQDIKEFVSPLNYILSNPVIIQNTPLDRNSQITEKFNSFFVSVMTVNAKLEIQGLRDRLEDLYSATNQSDDAVNSSKSSRSSRTPIASPSPMRSPLDQAFPRSPGDGSPQPSTSTFRRLDYGTQNQTPEKRGTTAKEEAETPKVVVGKPSDPLLQKRSGTEKDDNCFCTVQ